MSLSSKPLVSVCIPAYNAERFIVKTLESALALTYPNYEIIVSDDCSTDNTREIVEKYSERGVKLIKTLKNLGRYGNCNFVIGSSLGKYVLKLDADDLITPEHVSEQIAVMETDPHITFSHCACRLVDVNGKFIGYERSIHGSFIHSGVKEWQRYLFGPRAVNIVMIRRSAFDLVGGYDERYKYSGDWAMHRSLLRLGSVFYNDHVLATYRIHSIGKKGLRLLQAKEHLMHLKDMDRDWPENFPNKEKLLIKARYCLCMSAVESAALCSGHERDEILKLLPMYGNYLNVRILSYIISIGGSFLLRSFIQAKQIARQIIKSFLYRQ